MTARRVFEIRGSHGVVISFRTVDRDENRPGALMVMLPPNDAEYDLSGDDVEGLHQFTYDLLAGPTRDPRLRRLDDAQIMCGERTNSPANGDLECCLFDGHLRVGDFDHITATGVRFDTPGF